MGDVKEKSTQGGEDSGRAMASLSGGILRLGGNVVPPTSFFDSSGDLQTRR